MWIKDSLFGASKVKEVPMVKDFERHHAWWFPSMGPAGFTEIKKASGAGESRRLHLV
jgi:gamma-glutamylcysteine synthetase